MRILSIAVGLLVFFSTATFAAGDDQVRIYRADGTLQCGMGQERALAEDRKNLEEIGATVVSSEKRVLPVMIIQVCGAPTGRVNSFVISENDWKKIKAGFAGTLEFAQWVYDTETLEVYKYDGTLQCKMGKEVTPDQMAAELKAANIRVISKRKDTDGLMHISLCGASTGQVNVFEIPSEKFETARRLRFEFFVSRNVIRSLVGPSSGVTVMSVSGDAWPWPW